MGSFPVLGRSVTPHVVGGTRAVEVHEIRCLDCKTWWDGLDALAQHRWLAHGADRDDTIRDYGPGDTGADTKGDTMALEKAPCGEMKPAGQAMGGHKSKCKECRKILHPGNGTPAGVRAPVVSPKKKPRPAFNPPARLTPRTTPAPAMPTSLTDLIAGLKARVADGEAASRELAAVKKLLA